MKFCNRNFVTENMEFIIHFTDLTCDEYFVTEDAAKKGVVFENDSPTEVLEVLRYFGPEVNPDAPELPQ